MLNSNKQPENVSRETMAYSTSVDFLTVTTKTGQTSASMLQWLVRRLTSRDQLFTQADRWRFMGFVGNQRDQVRYGIRGDEAMVMCHGGASAELWRELAGLCDNCTRIDLQVTVELPARNKEVASVAYERVLDRGKTKGSLISSSDGGYTCYVGSRHSRFFGRLYDKGAQQGQEPGWIWRYEVEVKKPASKELLARLANITRAEREMAAFVYGWFTEHGIIPQFVPANGYTAIQVGRSEPSDDKSLLWLAKSVKPVLARLISNGRMVEAYEAMGLPTPRDIRALALLQEDL